MKSYPQNTKEWSKEAYQALIPAWEQLKANNPFPSEKQKEKLIEIATEMACANRDIKDPSFIKHAHEYVREVFLEDYNSRDVDEKINFSLCFILAYFDAHLSLSMITEDVAKKAIRMTQNNYDMSYEDLSLKKVTDQVYAIVGELSNRSPTNLGNNATFGVVVTDDGVVDKIIAGLGNGYFKKLGAKIIASKNAVEDQKARTQDQFFGLGNLVGDEGLKGTEAVYADTTFDTEHSFEFERMLGVGSQSNSKTWVEAYEAMAAYKPEHIIPGHGNPTDLATANKDSYEYLKFLRQAIADFIDDDGDISEISKVDQSAYKYLQNFDSLSGRNAATAFFLLLAISTKSFADNPLRVGYTYWPPYQIVQEDSGISGIVHDVLKEVERRMDVDFHMIRLPQKRMLSYFRNGELDLEPAANPIWRSEYKDLSVYSIPYFQVQHVIYVSDSTDVKGDYISDFKDKTIGTRLGFNYDLTIGEAFNRELIKRKDSQQHDANLMLLKAGRIDGIIVDRRELKYWLKKLDYDDSQYKEAYNIGSSIDVSMRLHKSQANLLPKLNRTLTEMLNEGFVDKAIVKYTSKTGDQRISQNIE
ncbi:L-cystine-binding protein FliY [Nymphon striatum]|nr:L-cystine-binding protein FliY [Nymphon striatum]